MERYTVMEVISEDGEFLGWAVYDASGRKVSNTFMTKQEAEREVQRLNELDGAEDEIENEASKPRRPADTYPSPFPSSDPFRW